MNFEKMYTTIDAHVEGEAFRVIVHSPFQLKAPKSLQEGIGKEGFLKETKQLLLNEPRGHRGMNGCIVLPANNADFSILFINHLHDKHFSYSGLIAALTVVLETGQIPVKQEGNYEIETIMGNVVLPATVVNEAVTEVQVMSSKCSVIKHAEDETIVKIDESRKYYIYKLPSSIATLTIENLSAIMKWGREAAKNHQDKSFSGIILVEELSENHFKSVTYEQDGVILRSPGFDTSFALYARQLEDNEAVKQVINESVFGSQLIAKRANNSECHYSIKSRGFVTGEHRFIYDPDDPLDKGFILQ